MRFNKWTLGLCAALAVAFSVQAQPTNTATKPTIQGGVQQIVDAFKSGKTNVWGEVHGLYAPALEKKYGGGVGLFWNLSDYVYSGVRVDYVDGDFWMPSGNVTVQAPIEITSWLTVAPLGYAGIGVPISGATVGGTTLGAPARDNNGDPTAILGYGVAVRMANITTSSKWVPKHIDVAVDSETWSGFKGQQFRLGILGNWTF